MSRLPNIVILTGAGVSAESGIATFRAEDGLWEQHRVEDVATPEGFYRNPALVQDFYNQRRAQLATVNPNPAHQAIARLQREWPSCVTLVTQNIDDLHERAQSPAVIHMHGELLKVRCIHSGRVYLWPGAVHDDSLCSCCTPSRTLRPHIVWFGEMPFAMDEIYSALRQADLFIAIGTSGNVYPAAGFVAEARRYFVRRNCGSSSLKRLPNRGYRTPDPPQAQCVASQTDNVDVCNLQRPIESPYAR